MIKRILPLVLLALALRPALAQDPYLAEFVEISIYHDARPGEFIFRADTGRYHVMAGEERVAKLKQGQAIFVNIEGGKAHLFTVKKDLGWFTALDFVGQRHTNAFTLKPSRDESLIRQYDDDLRLHMPNDSAHWLINRVGLPNYLAGVVKAESGVNAEYEYYRAQAVLARTYAMIQLRKRASGQAYDLIDGVGHQAYKGRNDPARYTNIARAVEDTRGLVVVDQADQPIEAVYHSNSGGQTANSEWVWAADRPYLKAVDDPHSTTESNATWTQTIEFDAFKEYLLGQGFTITDQHKAEDFAFRQPQRLEYFRFGGDSIRLVKIRAQFSLRSTFFDIIPESGKLRLNGRGYGHGVGMSQQGAMNMARQKTPYNEIIKFYFQGVKLVDLSTLGTEFSRFTQDPPQRGWWKTKRNKR